jgi:hypothetical protein
MAIHHATLTLEILYQSGTHSAQRAPAIPRPTQLNGTTPTAATHRGLDS